MLKRDLDLTSDRLFSTQRQIIPKSKNIFNLLKNKFSSVSELYSEENYGKFCIRCGSPILYDIENKNSVFFQMLGDNPRNFLKNIQLDELCNNCSDIVFDNKEFDIKHNEIKSFITLQENFNMEKHLNIILENLENNLYFNIEKNTLTFGFEEHSLILFDKDEFLFFIEPGRDVVNFIISIEKELCFNIMYSTGKTKAKEINKAIEFYVDQTIKLFKEVILEYIQKHWYEANLKNV